MVLGFQLTGFQWSAFQGGERYAGGGIKKRKRAKKQAPIHIAGETEEQKRAERERLGIVPPQVKRVIAQVAKESVAQLNANEADWDRALRQTLRRFALDYRAYYLRQLEQERERLVRAEIKRLLSVELLQQQRITEQLVLEERLMRQRRQRDEEDIAFLLLNA